MPHDTIRRIVPYPFEIDFFNNMAWVSIVLFEATHSRLRNMPLSCSFPRFYQMNIRTYVRFGNERGVYFLKIHTDNRIVKKGGTLTGLPFINAELGMEKGVDTFFFKGQHLFNNPKSSFSVTYEPLSVPCPHHENTLSYFLLERYCIWMIRNGNIVKAPIFHTNWSPYPADITILNSHQFSFPITEKSIAHFESFKHAMIHPFERIGKVLM